MLNNKAKSDVVFDYYNALLGTRFHHLHQNHLDHIDLPWLDLHVLVVPFTEAMIAKIV